MKRLNKFFKDVDERVRDLSHRSYSTMIGVMAGLGVISMGPIINNELRIIQAVTVGLVVAGLEQLLGKWQSE